jgi:HEAT repeat protein
MRTHLVAGLAVLSLALGVPRAAEPDKDLAPELIKILKDRVRYDEKARFKALETFVNLGPGAKSAAPELVAVVQDRVRYGLKFRMKALEGLAAIGPDAKPAVPALLEKDESVRLRAAKALGKLGADARAAVPALTEALRDADADVRRVAADSLAKINPK